MSKKSYVFNGQHHGIKMVDNMRQRGEFDDKIRSRFLTELLKLQQTVNGRIMGKSMPQAPEEKQIEIMENLEVALAYLDADDLSKPSAREAVAKAQAGENKQGSRLMSATWKQLRAEILDKQSSPAKKDKPGIHSIKLGRLNR